MRRRLVLPIFASLLLASSPSTVHAQVATATSATTETTGDWSSRRAVYLQRAKDRLHDWEGKISDFAARAQAEGNSEDQRASAELTQSWAHVKAETAKLETATREDWDNSVAAFERASRDLSNRWESSGKSNK